MRKIIMILMSIISITAFSNSNLNAASCPNALPTSDPGFCLSFKIAALCNCKVQGIPEGLCNSMGVDGIYKQMITVHGSVASACEWAAKKGTAPSKQECIDDWKCYREGGKDSNQMDCSGTGKKCS